MLGSLLVKDLLDHFDGAEGPRLKIYSAHDSNILPQLLMFGWTSPACQLPGHPSHQARSCIKDIPFAASLSWDLYQDQNQTILEVRSND